MTDLHISKESIGSFFSNKLSKNKKFIIPDYQRPYRWDVEKCETLWTDIEAFSRSEEAKNEESYFLGTIVSYENDENNPEIIDGQQRMTSFMLLLRAFYTRLEKMNQDNQNVIGLKRKLEPCIWDINRISGLVEDKSNIKIRSEVATDSDNSVFHKIMKTGEYNEKELDNYTRNYAYFYKTCEEYAQNNPLDWENLCVVILEQCIILPIRCDKQDTALTIFSTLNDRGLPLSDSDIFKAKIYKNMKAEDGRKEFVDKWKELSDICSSAKLTIDDVFRYYSHVIRARNSDYTKEIALRKFYLNNNNLEEEGLIDSLILLAKFWLSVREPEKLIDGFEVDFECRKFIQCLEYYPNEYWKYIISVFYHFNRNVDNKLFNYNFLKLLKKLISYLFVKFIEQPSVNAIKSDVFKYCAYLYGNNQYKEAFTVVNVSAISSRMTEYGTSKLLKSLILLHSYISSGEDQQVLIDKDFEIEHIFPKKWQNTNYNGWSLDDANYYLEKLGNKIPFEKKLNIQAGNGYFGNKKKKYKDSEIYEVKKLSHYHKDDWSKEDIEERDCQVIDTLTKFFKENLE